MNVQFKQGQDATAFVRELSKLFIDHLDGLAMMRWYVSPAMVDVVALASNGDDINVQVCARVLNRGTDHERLEPAMRLDPEKRGLSVLAPDIRAAFQRSGAAPAADAGAVHETEWRPLALDVTPASVLRIVQATLGYAQTQLEEALEPDESTVRPGPSGRAGGCPRSRVASTSLHRHEWERRDPIGHPPYFVCRGCASTCKAKGGAQ